MTDKDKANCPAAEPGERAALSERATVVPTMTLKTLWCPPAIDYPGPASLRCNGSIVIQMKGLLISKRGASPESMLSRVIMKGCNRERAFMKASQRPSPCSDFPSAGHVSGHASSPGSALSSSQPEKCEIDRLIFGGLFMEDSLTCYQFSSQKQRKELFRLQRHGPTVLIINCDTFKIDRRHGPAPHICLCLCGARARVSTTVCLRLYI